MSSIKKENIILLDEVNSTNKYVKDLVNAGLYKYPVVIAKKQIKGKGQGNNKFFSPEGGFYFSMAIYPNYNLDKVKYLTARVGVVVAKTIEELFNTEVQLKWINDIVFKNKKLGGILVEGKFNKKNDIDFLVIGIGINLKSTDNLPKELEKTFISLDIKNEEKAIKNLAKKLIPKIKKLEYDFIVEDLIKEYNSYLYKKDEIINLKYDNQILKGELLGIDNNLNVILKEKDRINYYDYNQAKIYRPYR